MKDYKDVTSRQLLNLGMPYFFHDKTIQNFVGSESVKKLVNKYCINLARNVELGVGLFIHGNGFGQKSLLACHVAKAAITFDFDIRILSLEDLTNFLLPVDDGLPKRKFEDMDFDSLTSLKFLVIDDIPDEPQIIYRPHIACLRKLVRRRLESVLPTVFVTRLGLDTGVKNILKIFGESVLDNLQLGCTMVECNELPKTVRQELLRGRFET